MQGATLNYAALLRALKLRLILRQEQNPAHFGGFIFFRNPKLGGPFIKNILENGKVLYDEG